MGLSRKKDKIKLTPEQREQKIDRKLRNIARVALIKLAEAHPEVMNKLIEKEFGITVPVYDPVRESEQKLRISIIDYARDMINNNPKLQERLAAGFLSSNAEDLGIEFDSPEIRLEKDKKRIQQIKEIMEMLGVKTNPSIWDDLKDPKVILGLINIADQIIALWRSNPIQESNRIYVVNINGKETEMSPEMYNAYKLTNKSPQARDTDVTTSNKEHMHIPDIISGHIAKASVQPDKISEN